MTSTPLPDGHIWKAARANRLTDYRGFIKVVEIITWVCDRCGQTVIRSDASGWRRTDARLSTFHDGIFCCDDFVIRSVLES